LELRIKSLTAIKESKYKFSKSNEKIKLSKNPEKDESFELLNPY
jgi:hypothetical protein